MAGEQRNNRIGDDGPIVLCGGYNAIALARKLRSPVIPDRLPLTVLSEIPLDIPEDIQDVHTVQGDPTSPDVLRRAGIASAETAVVLSDIRHTRNPDALSLLVALAIEDIRPEIFTVVEVHNASNIPHFDRTAVDATVCHAELSQLMMTQSAITNSSSEIYRELFDFQAAGSELYRVPVLETWTTFGDCSRALIPGRVIPIGLRRAGENLLNPGIDTSVHPGDELWVIAVEKPF